MMNTKKARLSAAVAAAIGGAALVTTGPMFAQDANAPTGYSPTGTGQAAIVPYYTVNGGWNTGINLTNTSDSALAVKVRFREARNSRDVLDFTIFLSPHDVWTGFLAAGDGEGAAPILKPTNDTSCTSPTVPMAGAPLLALAYSGQNDDGGPQSNYRMDEGYIELLVMGECKAGERCNLGPDGIGWMITHNAEGQPNNCAGAQARSVADPNAAPIPDLGGAFNGMAANSINASAISSQVDTSSGTPAQIYAQRSGAQTNYGGPASTFNPATDIGFGPVRHPAPLKANVVYVRSDLGAGFGTEALHLDAVVCSSVAPAVQPLAPGQDQSSVLPACAPGEDNGLMTAQSAVYFLEPTLGTMPAKLWDITGLDSVENRFKWTNVYNSWVSYAPNDQYANWVVNFPTKGYHVDQNCANVQAGNNAWRNNGVNVLNCRGDNSALYVATAGGNASGQRVTPPEAQVAPFSNLWNLAAVNTATDNPDRDNANSLVTAQAYVYDREEGMGTEGPIFSPAPNNPFVLPYETNVINFVTGDPDPLQSTIGSFLDVQTALDNPDAQYGWVNLQLNSSGGDALYQYRGLPSYGVMLQMRRASSATYFTGDMTNHGYSYQLK